jgi:hypothetical protein
MSIMAMQTGSSSIMHWEGFYNIILAHAKLQIIQSPTPQLNSKPMFMNKVAVPAAPLEEDNVAELVVAEELVVALLPLLPIPT